MKKVLLIVMAVLITATFAFSAEETNVGDSKLTWAGWDTIAYGWPKLNASGQITSIQGITLGIGYGYRNYFSPVKLEQSNFYWEIGADLFGISSSFAHIRAGAGLTYPIPLKNVEFDNLYLTGGFGVSVSLYSLFYSLISPYYNPNFLFGILSLYPWIGAAIIF